MGHTKQFGWISSNTHTVKKNYNNSTWVNFNTLIKCWVNFNIVFWSFDFKCARTLVNYVFYEITILLRFMGLIDLRIDKKNPFKDSKFISKRNFFNMQVLSAAKIHTDAVHIQCSIADSIWNQTQRFHSGDSRSFLNSNS